MSEQPTPEQRTPEPEPGKPQPEKPQPTLRPTRPTTLFVAGLASAAITWILVGQLYDDFNGRLPWPPALFVGLLAVVEFIAAWTTKARIDGKPGTEPVEPLAVARYAVLAKASSLGGAILIGLYGAILAYVWVQHTVAGDADTPIATVCLGAGVLLLVAGLLLERACRIPDRPDDEESDGSRSATPHAT